MRDTFVEPSRLGPGLVCAALFAFVVFSPPAGATQVTGTISDASVSGPPKISFTCSLSGTTCTGVATTLRGANDGCSNGFVDTVPFSLTGLNLSQPGSFQGSYSESKNNFNSVHNADGTCTYSQGSPATFAPIPFTGTWNGTTGSLDLSGIGD